nr:hypothetical protein CFP56_78200 [Quercus suber]
MLIDSGVEIKSLPASTLGRPCRLGLETSTRSETVEVMMLKTSVTCGIKPLERNELASTVAKRGLIRDAKVLEDVVELMGLFR